MAIKVECVEKGATDRIGSLEIGSYFYREGSKCLRLVIDKDHSSVTYICIGGNGQTKHHQLDALTKVYPVDDVDIRWSV